MIGHHHKGHIHLKRGIGKRTQKLKLRILFERHQIQQSYFQGTDVLVHRTVLIHHKNIFTLQYFFCWKIILYSNRHLLFSPLFLLNM